MIAVDELEKMLRGLLKSEHSSLTISFNEGNGPSYESVGEYLDGLDHELDWVSDEEREKAIATNSMWDVQWYPDSPVGFCRVCASSLTALVAHLVSSEGGA